MPLSSAIRVVISSSWFDDDGKMVTYSAGNWIYDPAEIQMLIARDPFFGSAPDKAHLAHFEAVDPKDVSPGEWPSAHGRDLRVLSEALADLSALADLARSSLSDDAGLSAFASDFDTKARGALDLHIGRIRTGLAARAPKATA